jgi:hypothetical protein
VSLAAAGRLPDSPRLPMQMQQTVGRVGARAALTSPCAVNPANTAELLVEYVD